MTRIPSQAFTTPGAIGASAPPATITSARPARMISAASPMACEADAHAVEMHSVGPSSRYFIEMWEAAALYMMRGIVNGCVRVTPLSYMSR